MSIASDMLPGSDKCQSNVTRKSRNTIICIQTRRGWRGPSKPRAYIGVTTKVRGALCMPDRAPSPGVGRPLPAMMTESTSTHSPVHLAAWLMLLFSHTLLTLPPD